MWLITTNSLLIALIRDRCSPTVIFACVVGLGEAFRQTNRQHTHTGAQYIADCVISADGTDGTAWLFLSCLNGRRKSYDKFLVSCFFFPFVEMKRNERENVRGVRLAGV